MGLFTPEEQATIRHRLSDTLKAVISQRLVLRHDGSGLVPAVEVLVVTRSVQEAIRENSGQSAPLAKLQDLVRQLDEALLLDTERFAEELASRELLKVHEEIRIGVKEGK